MNCGRTGRDSDRQPTGAYGLGPGRRATGNDATRSSLYERVVCRNAASADRQRRDSRRRVADGADDELDWFACDGDLARLTTDDPFAQCETGAETSEPSNCVASSDGCHVSWRGLQTAPYPICRRPQY